MSGFGETVLNAGSGGPNLATSSFTNPTTTHVDVMPWSGLVYLASGNPDDGTAVFQVIDATHGLPAAIVSALPAGTNVIGHVIVDSGSVTIANASIAVTGTFWQATQPISGTVTVGNATLAVTQGGTWTLGAGSAVIGHVVNDAGTAVIGGVVPSAAVGAAPVGANPFHAISAANTTPVQIKGTGGTSSAGTLWEMIGVNVGTSALAYAKFYDKATAPTVGTDTPAYVVPLPTAGSANGAGAARSWPTGLKFANGIWLAITTGMGDSDNTAPAASQVLVSGSYS